LAKGAGNVAGAFFGCLPTSASWTRSAINLQMGSKTRWVGVIAGVTVLVIMLVAAPWARYVPKACLGAIIAWIAWQMVDLEAARYVWRWSRADAAVLVVTYASTLVFPIQYAIYFGVFVSLALLVSRVGRLHLVEMTVAGNRAFREIELDDETGSYPIVVLQLEGDLFFGVVDELEESLERIAARGAKAIVIRLKRAHAIDATASEALASFAEHFREDGGRLVLCGLRPDFEERIRRSHLGEVLGAENLLPTGAEPFASIRQAVEAVRRELADRGGLGPDDTPIRPALRDLPEAWSYSI
jgi:SulP family sulfate permease